VDVVLTGDVMTKVTTFKPKTSDILDEMMDKMSAELAEEIDFDVMSRSLIPIWTLVELEPFNLQTREAVKWAKAHITGGWIHSGSFGGKFLFEREEDATAFLLKWK
jgi:hypothetical protein